MDYPCENSKFRFEGNVPSLALPIIGTAFSEFTT